MSAIEAPAPGRGPSPLGMAGRTALRDGFDTTAHWLGLGESRADREDAPLTIRLGVPGATDVTVIDRREAEPRTHRLDPGAEDFSARLIAIRGAQAGVGAKVLLDPALCFIRSLSLPSAALPRMRAVLAQELEATTPFKPESVHSDWYVESEDVPGRMLRVCHVVVKRRRLDPLLAALAEAGIAAGPVTVGADEARTLPVDLLSGGHRSLRGLVGPGRGNLALLAGAALLLPAAFLGFRAHQDATLSALDTAFAAARRAAGPPVPPTVQAGTAAILARRAPPLARTWDALAAALPDSASATDLRLDSDGAQLTLSVADESAALAALARVPGFGAPFLQESSPGLEGRRQLVVLLPRTDRGAQR